MKQASHLQGGDSEGSASPSSGDLAQRKPFGGHDSSSEQCSGLDCGMGREGVQAGFGLGLIQGPSAQLSTRQDAVGLASGCP